MTHLFLRFQLRAKPESAKQHIAVTQQIAFPLKEKSLGSIDNTVFPLFEETGKRTFFHLPFFVAEMTRNKCLARNDACVRCENHIGTVGGLFKGENLGSQLPQYMT